MTAAHSLFAFVGASTWLIIVPGSSVLFVISRGVALGRRAALLTVAGNSAGAFAQVIVVAAGLGALLERSAVLFDAIRLLGAAYRSEERRVGKECVVRVDLGGGRII